MTKKPETPANAIDCGWHLDEPFESQLRAAMRQRDLADSARQKNTANARVRSIRLRAARAKGSHTEVEWRQLIGRLDGRCASCGAREPAVKLQKDHVIPIYQGGSDAIENLQPLCAGCNSSKGPDSFNWVAYRLLNGFDK